MNTSGFTSKRTPEWMTYALVAAAVYNFIWGAIAVFAPNSIFEWTGMTVPRYPELWQCIGMIVGVYGIGYLIAAWDPVRHWPIVLVGLLGKIFGPIGFAFAIASGRFTLSFSINIILNDLIWWGPFMLILYHAYTFTGGRFETSLR